jgi:hypothetical protein
MEMAKEKSVDYRQLTATGAVNVTIPAKVAFDIDALFEVQRSVFERLGHPACYSGADIRFILERDFIVGLDGKLQR